MVCRGRENSTIVEGQRLGTVHIMEGTCSGLRFFRECIYIHIHIHVHVHMHVHIQIHVHIHVLIHVRVRVCLCFFFLLCGAVGGVVWSGVVWCVGAKVAEQVV